MLQRDRRTRCKHPDMLALVRNQKRYGREAQTRSPAKERDPKSGKELYKSVYSSIAPLILVDGHTTYVNFVFVIDIDFVFLILDPNPNPNPNPHINPTLNPYLYPNLSLSLKS